MRKGVKKNKPSHVRYKNTDRRTKNKIRRITKCNGTDFLARWKKELAAR